MEIRLILASVLLCCTPALAEQPAPPPDPAAKITITHGEFMTILDAAREQGVAVCKAQSVANVMGEIDKQAMHLGPYKVEKSGTPAAKHDDPSPLKK